MLELFDKIFKFFAHPALPQPVGAPPTPPPTTPAQIAAAATLPIPGEALTFVEVEEDGSAAYYVKTESHWSWPGGISGATAAIGYDLGQVTLAELVADWTGIVDDATLQKMKLAVGLQGARAQAFVQAHRDDITITWDQAVNEFKNREVPKWLMRCRAALPNFNALPGLCQGALFSLSYNRGTGGYDDPGSRDTEMRAIKQAMALKNFAAIPALIRSMSRLWPTVKDLRDRREHEAALFEKGLAATTA